MTWLDCEDAARIPLTEEAVLRLLRRHFGEIDAVYVHPHVPPGKELAARRAHAALLPPQERILALYDAPDASSAILAAQAWVGSGARALAVHRGFVLTSTRICWKNEDEPACALEWADLDPERIAIDRRLLSLGEDAAVVIAEPELQNACANAFHVLALSARCDAPSATSRETIPDGLAEDLQHEESGLVRTGASLAAPEQGPASGAWSTIPVERDSASYGDYASHARLQGPEYSCWHCLTPLYQTTPECAFCGVAPSENGWLRTA